MTVIMPSIAPLTKVQKCEACVIIPPLPTPTHCPRPPFTLRVQGARSSGSGGVVVTEAACRLATPPAPPPARAFPRRYGARVVIEGEHLLESRVVADAIGEEEGLTYVTTPPSAF